MNDLYKIQLLTERTKTLKQLYKEQDEKLSDHIRNSEYYKRRKTDEDKYQKRVSALGETVEENERIINDFIELRRSQVITHFQSGECTIPCYALEQTKTIKEEKKRSPQEVLSKISTLFDNEDVGRHVLEMVLSQNTIIAGGAVVYGLCKHVKRLSVSDIDVFVGSESDFLELIRAFRPYCIKPMMASVNNYMYEGNLTDGKNDKAKAVYSVINIDIGQRILIQLILTKNGGTSVVDLFDLDYVCCAVDMTRIVITDDCAEAHERKRVMRGYFEPCVDRLIKAREKGFEVSVLFGKQREDPCWASLEQDDTQNIIISPCERRSDAFAFKMEDVRVEGKKCVVNEKTFDEHKQLTCFFSPWQTCEPVVYPRICRYENAWSIHQKCREFWFYCEDMLDYFTAMAQAKTFNVIATGEIVETPS